MPIGSCFHTVSYTHLPLHILLLGITAASTLIMYQHTRTTYQNMIDFFMDEIDTSLDFISRFLVNTAAENSTFQSIAYDYSDADLNMESIRLYQYLPVSYTHLIVKNTKNISARLPIRSRREMA